MSIIETIIKRAIAEAVSDAVARGGTIDADAIAAKSADKIVSDPVAVNQMNLEPAYQSRVVMGSTVSLVFGIVSAVVHIADMVQTGNVDTNRAYSELAIIFGSATVLYGRLKAGLRPLFAGRK